MSKIVTMTCCFIIMVHAFFVHMYCAFLGLLYNCSRTFLEGSKCDKDEYDRGVVNSPIIFVFITVSFKVHKHDVMVNVSFFKKKKCLGDHESAIIFAVLHFPLPTDRLSS